MRILVVGAAGQLGRALQVSLAQHDLVALTHDRLDITRLGDVQAALAAHAPDLVINAAAYNKVDAAETEPQTAYATNALGPRNLAVASARTGRTLMHVSTDYVFDGMSTRPYHEFDRPQPRSVYGASKLAGEEAVRTLNPRHYIVRTSWLYDTTGQNFPRTMCALASRPAVRVVSDQYGSPTYVPHLAEAIGRLIDSDAFGTFHLGGLGGTSWYALTCTLYGYLGIGTPVEPVATAEFPRPAERPRYSVLTTLQDPQILLPPWQEGLRAFAQGLHAGTA